MKLYIPDISEQIVLTKPFTVNVQLESRNETLIKAKFPYIHKNIEKLRKISQEIPYGWEEDVYKEAGLPFENKEINSRTYYHRYENPVLQLSLQRIKERQQKAHQNLESFERATGLIVTFPRGTVLEIDRIYIRKNAAEFSSVTFKIREKNKVLRFWAKLEDVNKIEGNLLIL